MNKKTFIVHGPRACGKTTNRKAIAQQLTGDANAFVDDFDSPRGMPKIGSVHFGIDLPTMSDKMRRERIENFQCIRFEDVIGMDVDLRIAQPDGEQGE